MKKPIILHNKKDILKLFKFINIAYKDYQSILIERGGVDFEPKYTLEDYVLRFYHERQREWEENVKKHYLINYDLFEAIRVKMIINKGGVEYEEFIDIETNQFNDIGKALGNKIEKLGEK